MRYSAEKVLDGEYQWMLEEWVERCRGNGDSQPVLTDVPEIIAAEVLRQAGVMIATIKYDTQSGVFIVGD